jgi:uncharacterized membrane protein
MSSRSFTPSIKVEHVISFSDAIFAFAITLMALSIDIPDLPSNLTQSEVLDKLYGLFPQFESYIISFAVIVIFWYLIIKSLIILKDLILLWYI